VGLTSLAAVTATFALAAGAQAATSTLDARGSAEQVDVTGADPGAQLTLVDGAGATVATHTVNALGGALFRRVAPGGGYHVQQSSDGETSPAITVFGNDAAPPSTGVYDQTIPSRGYGYLTTRDGTKLAIDVHPPQDVLDILPQGSRLPTLPSGPTPTLIEYSGYGFADPDGPQNGIALVANLMGFTVVDVSMRGTGCSGGAYDFFEPLQGLDGYDVIETIARQPWVKGHKVGMIGISYGGISQLFTAQLNPPSLAAIAPLSVIDNTQTTLYPGGVLNTGFAVSWAQERVHDALPASADGGQAWAYQRIQDGDSICQDNQALHPEAVDLIQKVRANSHYVPEVADPLSPVTFVDRIHMPVYLACQWTDEQTGGHCPTLAEHMTGTNRKWFTFTNGTHIDALDPETFNRWYDFLELYVAHQAPILNAAFVRATAPLVYQEAMGITGVILPRDPVQEQLTYNGALTQFESLKPVRVLFENGAGGLQPGLPYPTFERSFDAFPIPGTTARTWYFGADGTLGDAAGTGADSFTWNPAARPLTDFSGDTGSGSGGLWTTAPAYDWRPNPAGTSVSYTTAPLPQDTTVIGAGLVKAWVKTSVPDVDLQATITEVRPDGKEVFVQSGWLRADERALDPQKSTPLEPVLSLREADVRPMPADQYEPVTIPLYYQGHPYRAGSSIRVTISAPNGDQPIWAFGETEPSGTTTVSVAHDASMPSQLTLPVVPDVTVPAGLPACPGLRGEPCRATAPGIGG
jgi:predicted acyl esterase